MKPLIVTLTEPGKQLADRLLPMMAHAEHCHRPKPFTQTLQQAFHDKRPLCLIMATGIAVRTLAPVLRDKHSDPPVLVLDEQGRFVVPLLSGHEGGANAWGAEVARALNAQCVVTGANDYTMPAYVAGMGCARDTSKEDLFDLLRHCLDQAGLRLDQLRAIASIDVKADEKGLIALAAETGLPFICYEALQLNEMEPLLSQRSHVVFNEVGCYGVAEGAALLHAKKISGNCELLLPKQKTTFATCAIARGYLQPETEVAL